MACSIMAVSLIGAAGPHSAVGKSRASLLQRQTEDQCLVNYDWNYEIAYKANQSNPLAKPQQLKWNGSLSVRGLTLVRFNAFFSMGKQEWTGSSARYCCHFWTKQTVALQVLRGRCSPASFISIKDRVLYYRRARQAFQSSCLYPMNSARKRSAQCWKWGEKNRLLLCLKYYDFVQITMVVATCTLISLFPCCRLGGESWSKPHTANMLLQWQEQLC